MQARGYKDILHALRTCMFDANGSMSEYELYFTWAWHMYRLCLGRWWSAWGFEGVRQKVGALLSRIS